MEKKLLEKLWNAARDGAYTQNGFTYQNLNEWLRDNPDVALSMSGVSESVCECLMCGRDCKDEGVYCSDCHCNDR